MHKENCQADVEQDDHADHDGVWTLVSEQSGRKSFMVVKSLIYVVTKSVDFK